MALLISECFVKPKKQVKESMEPHYLGPDDLIMLSLHYMQQGLLFNNNNNPPKSTQYNIDSFLNNLKQALSLSLVHFYPLAGRLETKKYENEHRSWVYVDSNSGPGARFIHAKVNTTIEEITLSVTHSFFELGETGIVNHDGHSRALVSVQVTELVDGLFIGFTMNHAVADGTTLWHFINTLSEICCFNVNTSFDEEEEYNGMVISSVPVYRPLCWGELDNPVIKLPYLEREEFIAQFSTSGDRVVEKMFRFSAESVARLKAIANGEAGTETRVISSFQSVCALVWKSITKARILPIDKVTTFFLVVNTRPRLEPPLSAFQFGNFGAMAKGECRVDELLESGLGSVAMLLNRAVPAQDDSTIRSAWKSYVKTPFVAKPGWSASIFGSRPIVMAGSTRFNMYGHKFGLGKPVSVRSGYGNRSEGKLSAHPGSKVPGSVDLSMSLSEDTFINLESDQEFMSYVS